MLHGTKDQQCCSLSKMLMIGFLIGYYVMNSMCCISCCLNVIMQIIILDHGAMTTFYQQIQTDETSFTNCIFTLILCVNFLLSLLIVFSY